MPKGLEGLEWDACTGDALKRLTLRGDRLVTTGGVAYKALLMADNALVTDGSRRLIDEWKAAGFVVLQSGETIPRTLLIEQRASEVVHTHRHLNGQELYYLANKENHAVDVAFRLQDQPSKVIVWHHATGKRTTLKKRTDGSYRLRLKPVESVCITYENNNNRIKSLPQCNMEYH